MKAGGEEGGENARERKKEEAKAASTEREKESRPLLPPIPHPTPKNGKDYQRYLFFPPGAHLFHIMDAAALAALAAAEAAAVAAAVAEEAAEEEELGGFLFVFLCSPSSPPAQPPSLPSSASASGCSSSSLLTPIALANFLERASISFASFSRASTRGSKVFLIDSAVRVPKAASFSDNASRRSLQPERSAEAQEPAEATEALTRVARIRSCVAAARWAREAAVKWAATWEVFLETSSRPDDDDDSGDGIDVD